MLRCPRAGDTRDRVVVDDVQFCNNTKQHTGCRQRISEKISNKNKSVNSLIGNKCTFIHVLIVMVLLTDHLKLPKTFISVIAEIIEIYS